MEKETMGRISASKELKEAALAAVKNTKHEEEEFEITGYEGYIARKEAANNKNLLFIDVVQINDSDPIFIYQNLQTKE